MAVQNLPLKKLWKSIQSVVDESCSHFVDGFFACLGHLQADTWSETSPKKPSQFDCLTITPGNILFWIWHSLNGMANEITSVQSKSNIAALRCRIQTDHPSCKWLWKRNMFLKWPLFHSLIPLESSSLLTSPKQTQCNMGIRSQHLTKTWFLDVFFWAAAKIQWQHVTTVLSEPFGKHPPGQMRLELSATVEEEDHMP